MCPASFPHLTVNGVVGCSRDNRCDVIVLLLGTGVVGKIVVAVRATEGGVGVTVVVDRLLGSCTVFSNVGGDNLEEIFDEDTIGVVVIGVKDGSVVAADSNGVIVTIAVSCTVLISGVGVFKTAGDDFKGVAVVVVIVLFSVVGADVASGDFVVKGVVAFVDVDVGVFVAVSGITVVGVANFVVVVAAFDADVGVLVVVVVIADDDTEDVFGDLLPSISFVFSLSFSSSFALYLYL